MSEIYTTTVTLSDGSTATVKTPQPLGEKGKEQVAALIERQRQEEGPKLRLVKDDDA